MMMRHYLSIMMMRHYLNIIMIGETMERKIWGKRKEKMCRLSSAW